MEDSSQVLDYQFHVLFLGFSVREFVESDISNKNPGEEEEAVVTEGGAQDGLVGEPGDHILVDVGSVAVKEEGPQVRLAQNYPQKAHDF